MTGGMRMQKQVDDYLDEESSTPIGTSVRYQMIKPDLPEKRQRVYEVILQHPEGITRKQIAKALGWPINCVTGRVTELRDQEGLIREAGTTSAPCYDGRMYPNGVLKAL